MIAGMTIKNDEGNRFHRVRGRRAPRAGRTKRDRPPSLSRVVPGEGGSPFFSVANYAFMSYKRERGSPDVPVPGSRTQTHSKERYSLLYHEGSNQRATPFSLSFTRLRPRGVKPPGTQGVLLETLVVNPRAERAGHVAVHEAGVELAHHAVRLGVISSRAVEGGVEAAVVSNSAALGRS